MADNKKYYYLKLKDNFYESEEMITIQSMQDGYLYSDILLKLYLRSLKSEGKLMVNNMIPYTPEVLAKLVRHQVGTVKQALQIFQQFNLVEILDNGAIYMNDIQNFIGLSSTEADRKREYRERINTEKKQIGQMSGQMSDKSPLENRDKILDIRDNNININNNNNNNNYNIIYDDDDYNSNIFAYIENNFGRTLTPLEYEEISTWENNELTKYAIKKAILNGKYNLNYIKKILHNYKMNNINTVQEAISQEEEYNNSKHKISSNSNYVSSSDRIDNSLKKFEEEMLQEEMKGRK